MGDLINYLQKHNRSFPIGLSKLPGAGYILTGGVSPLSRSYGLAIDNIESIKGFLGNGTFISLKKNKINTEEQLIWEAIKGAAPFFSIITEIGLNTIQSNPIKVIEGFVNLNELSEIIKLSEEFPENISLQWIYAQKIYIYIFVYFSKKSDTDLNNINEDLPISNYDLSDNGFLDKDYVSEEVLVDFKCDWSRIIENHLDILHLFWVHGDTIPDKDVNKNVLVSFNQKININPKYIESIYYYKNDPTKELINELEKLIAIHGKVKTIILPSASGLEHKIGLPALSRIFKDAEIWLCPGQGSFPINLPLDFLGIPSKRSRILFEEGTPHSNSFKWSSLGPLNLGLGRYQEISCFHYSTKTLHVTDAIVGIDSTPPEIFNFDPTPLLFHSRERGDEPLIDSIEQRKKGYRLGKSN